ncbi:hypothetical protein I3843_16G073700 [Carya illinoinensis]|nr:hypothetical protein I3843_16G073700 [Carya illinoinensis]
MLVFLFLFLVTSSISQGTKVHSNVLKENGNLINKEEKTEHNCAPKECMVETSNALVIRNCNLKGLKFNFLYF